MTLQNQQLGFLEGSAIEGLPDSLRFREHPGLPMSKGPGAFKTISETAKLLGVPQHVLRFWESRFRQIKPLKLKGGRRYYRPEDIQLLLRIKALLYQHGYTIKGARKALNQARRSKMEYLAQTLPAILPDEDDYVQQDLLAQPVMRADASATQKPASAISPQELQSLKQELNNLKSMLSDALKQ